MITRTHIVVLTLFALGTLVFTGCRSRLGGDCEANDDCGLGLYCDLEKKVCDDRGKLLKKQAEEVYVYPIPGKKAVVPVPVPTPRPTRGGTHLPVPSPAGSPP
jgi:hypothetical protein